MPGASGSWTSSCAPSEGPVAVLQDLAVGFDAGGFDAWYDQDLLALTCRIGAPPDELGPEGQDWGLPPTCRGSCGRPASSRSGMRSEPCSSTRVVCASTT